MLPDEVLKEIENGPREDRTGHISVHEGSEDFATRIAELATRLEREACVKVCNAAHYDNYQLYRKSRSTYDDGRCDEAANLSKAIEARGRKA